MFAILKNRLVDEFRRHARAPQSLDEGDEALDGLVDDQFDGRDHWRQFPAEWGDPEQALEQASFWAVLDACLDNLPARPARVFAMRELLDMDTDEICKELAISTSNCWVLLHRARSGLRDCLSRRWFGDAN